MVKEAGKYKLQLSLTVVSYDARGAAHSSNIRPFGAVYAQQERARDAQKLYERMCKLTGTRQDPCVLDTYRCAIEQ